MKFTSYGLNRQSSTILLFGTKTSALAHRSREIYCAENFTNAQIYRQTPRPPPAPRACAAPTESYTRIVVVCPIECDHIYVNRVISHEVIVSEYITLQTLHRRLRPGTPMCRSDSKDVFTSKISLHKCNFYSF